MSPPAQPDNPGRGSLPERLRALECSRAEAGRLITDPACPSAGGKGWLDSLDGGELAVGGVGRLPGWSHETSWGQVLSVGGALIIVAGQVRVSSLTATEAHAYLRSAASVVASEGLTPGGLLKRLSSAAAALGHLKAHALCLRIRPTTGWLEAARAGPALAPMLVHGGRVASLHTPACPPLGVPAGATTVSRSWPLPPGALLLAGVGSGPGVWGTGAPIGQLMAAVAAHSSGQPTSPTGTDELARLCHRLGALGGPAAATFVAWQTPRPAPRPAASVGPMP